MSNNDESNLLLPENYWRRARELNAEGFQWRYVWQKVEVEMFQRYGLFRYSSYHGFQNGKTRELSRHDSDIIQLSRRVPPELRHKINPLK